MLLPPRDVARGAPVLPWPPILATWGAGRKSELHAHHSWHLVLALRGALRVSTRNGGTGTRASAVLTKADTPHAIDARDCDVLILFVDAESDVAAALASNRDQAVTIYDERAAASLREPLPRSLDARSMGRALPALLEALGASVPLRRTMHPAVRRAIGRLRSSPIDAPVSLEALSAEARLSPSRFLHAFTDSIGIPLRPYLLWLKLERAAAALAADETLAAAAHAAGFSDAAHMTRTFRRMFGVVPSALRRS